MKVIKHADKDARSENNRPTMHGSKSEWRLMSGTGALIKWSAEHVAVTGEAPDCTPDAPCRPEGSTRP